MTAASSEIANRYVSALLKLVDETKDHKKVAEDLQDLQKAIGGSAELQTLLSSPLIDRNQKAAVVNTLITKGKGHDIVRRFVGVVAQNNRLAKLPQMIDAFLDELSRRSGEVVAQVTAAHKLDADQQKALTDTLKNKLGAKVKLDIQVNPSILGGLVVQVGSQLIDSSLKTKLSKLEHAMKGAA